MIILISGLPASGKSYFARALGKRLEAPVLSSDQIRTEMDLRGQYDKEDKEAVYKEMYRRAQTLLPSHEQVLLDATFSKARQRKLFQQLSQKNQRPLIIIAIHAKEATIRSRMQEKRTYSEATFEVYQKIKMQFEPFTESVLDLWSDELSLDEMLKQATDYLQAIEENVDA